MMVVSKHSGLLELIQVQKFIPLLLLTPLILLPDLVLLRLGEVIPDVEGPSDLFRGLALDHVGHSLAGDIQEALDVQVVGSQDQVEENCLLHAEEILVPLGDVIRSSLTGILIIGERGVILVLLRPLDDQLQDLTTHIWQGDLLLFPLLRVHAQVLQHGLDGGGHLGDFHFHGEVPVVGTRQNDLRHFGA